MRRRHAAVGLAVTVAAGLGSRRFPIGLSVWDKSLGDALYTVMLYLLALLLRPGLRPAVAGAAALSLSIAIEAFQLTGIPARLPRALQVALGTTFAWHDIACYFAGALVAVAVHGLAARR
ncbi:MAG: DUF2809 domain-containing protein [Labilithrix sp.]|nr:DUF2809 domain-containing protein [Labilithrix sp.]